MKMIQRLTLRTLSLAGGIALLSAAPTALAQDETPSDAATDAGQPPNESSAEASADEGTARKMDLSVPPMEQPVQRTEYVHNGFYFRFAVGPGYSYTSLTNREFDVTAGSSAFSLATNVMVGGSPSPGFALGVGALTNLHLGASFEGTTAPGMFQFTVGPFFDAFPNDKGPFHVGTLVGLSAMTLGEDISPASSVVGGGVGAWLGWDFFVAPEWSAGMKWQVGGAYMVGEETAASNFNTNLMITILRH